jgi:hypothetical protein
MFRVRVIRVVAGLTAGLLLTACSGTSGNFDPTDWITGEFFSTKTPLPGDRKPVFPGGVPGVPEGVPPELVKGNQQPVVEAAAEPAPAAKPAQPARQATRPAPKPRTASAPPQPAPVRAVPAASPAQPATANQPGVAWPDPSQAQAPRPTQSSPPAANWPEPNTQANWPPPDPNAFSR